MSALWYRRVKLAWKSNGERKVLSALDLKEKAHKSINSVLQNPAKTNKLMKVAGKSFLAVLMAAGLLPFIPSIGEAFRLHPEFIAVLSGLGIEFLAKFIEDFWEDLNRKPPKGADEVLERLTASFKARMEESPEAQRAVNCAIDELGLIEVAREAMRGKEEAYGPLLVSVQSELLEFRQDFKRSQSSLEEMLKRIETVLLERLPKPPTLPDMRPYIQATVENERFAQWGDERYIEEKTRPLPMRVAPYELGLYTLGGQPKQDLIEAVEEIFAKEDTAKRRVLILGDPGAGKTTALEKLMLLYAQHGLADKEAHLPILVPLDRYAGQDSLIPSLVASLNEVSRLKLPKERVKVFLREQDCLVMFDGVNELAKWREEGVRLIKAFMATYPHHRYVITCRTQVYHNEFEGIDALEVQELEDEDIEHYLKVRLREKGWSLYRRLDKRLKGLARNPLMLRMIKEAGLRGELPRNRGELFRSFIHQMLWREKGKGARIPGEVKEGALARLGYAMQEGRVLRCSEGEVRQAFTAYLRISEERYSWRDVLNDVVLSGLFKRAEWREYTFMHQVVQEHFTAVALSTGEVLKLDWQALAKDNWWAETIVLLSGITQDTSGLASAVAKADALLASRCLLEGREVSDETRRIVVDSLTSALRDGDRGMCIRAAKALGKIGGRQAVNSLFEALKDSRDAPVRWEAAYALAEIGEPAVEPLIEALRHGGARRRAARALAKIGKPAVEPLAKALSDKDRFARRKAAQALGEIGDRRAVEPLIRALNDSDEIARRWAARALGEIGDRRAVEPLIEALSDSDGGVRRWAVLALAEIKERIEERETIEPLIETLKTKDIHIRRRAAQALAKVGEPAIEFLIKALSGGDELVRRRAAWALGELRVRRAIEPLIEALKDRSKYVRIAAAAALSKMGGEQVVEALIEILSDSNYDVRREAARALGEIGDRRAVEPLIEALSDSNGGVRRWAARALGRGGERAVEPLIEALSDSNQGVRRWAAWALGNIGDRRAVEPLIEALSDSNPKVRGRAAQALGKIKDKRALPKLEQLAGEDEVPGVAKATRKAVKRRSARRWARRRMR
jgi:HEAT repeat protein